MGSLALPRVLGTRSHYNGLGVQTRAKFPFDRDKCRAGLVALTEPLAYEYRILPNNGAGWSWELVTQEREVIARGVAETDAQARIEAMRAGLDCGPLNQ
jgi:di/tripeptidase